MADLMSEHTENNIEKVTTPPLAQSTATPTLAGDDAAPEGHVVTCTGEPNASDILVWDNVARKWRPQAQSTLTTGSPVTVSDGMGGFAIVFDEDGNVVTA